MYSQVTANGRYNLTNVYSDYDDLLYFNESGPIDMESDVDQVFTDYETSFADYIVAAGYRVSQGLIDQNVKTGLTLNNWTARTPAEKAVEWWEFDWEYGQPPAQSSWVEAVNNYNYTFAEWSEDNMFVVDQRGFKVLVEEEAKTFLQSEQVMFNTTVTNISYGEDGVTITTTNSNGTEYTIEAEYVIITFSIGVLQHDAATLFTPELPNWKTESIQAFAMSTYTKIFLSFPEKFWNSSQYSLYIDPYTRGRYPIWQDLSLPNFFPGSNITFVTVADDQSYIVESQPEETTKAEILGILADMYPDIEIPEPNGFLLPKWASDPLFRGSYSNWPVGYPKALHDQLSASVGGGRLVFSGEATSYKYYGFLQGAYFEGIRAAQDVAQCLVSGCAGIEVQDILRGCNGL
jgi:polyamine oxidase